jgi:hypothetical protein
VFDAFLERMKTAFREQGVGLPGHVRAGEPPLVALRQLDLECVGHLAGHLVLKVEHIVQRRADFRAPQRTAAVRGDELHRDAHAPTEPLEGSVDDGVDAKLETGLHWIHLRPLKAQDGGGGPDEQLFDHRQFRDRGVGQAQSERGVGRVLRQIVERAGPRWISPQGLSDHPLRP